MIVSLAYASGYDFGFIDWLLKALRASGHSRRKYVLAKLVPVARSAAVVVAACRQRLTLALAFETESRLRLVLLPGYQVRIVSLYCWPFVAQPEGS